MKTFSIEPMQLIDYEQVYALWQSCGGLGDLETHAEFQKYLERNPMLSTVARANEKIVGAVFCGHDGRRGYLYHLAVAIEMRKQGIAEAIVQHCLEGLAALGIPRCSIHLYADNNTGQAFWERVGWRERIDLKVFAKDIPPNEPSN